MQGNILLKKLNLAQKIYEEHFLNKEFLCIYEEQEILKEFKLIFNSGHFKHLTGVEFIKNNYESTAKNFYKAVKNGRLDLSNIKIGNFTEIKLNHFSDLQNIFYSSSIYYKFSPEKGNSNWLFIDSFITKNNRNLKSTSLGITEESSNKFVPSSLFHDIPERKGKYIGKILLVGFRNVLKKEDIYNTIFRITDIENIPNEIKNKFKNLENYNCFTGNILKNFQHKNGEFRWIAKDDVIKLGIPKKNNAELKHNISHKDFSYNFFYRYYIYFIYNRHNIFAYVKFNIIFFKYFCNLLRNFFITCNNNRFFYIVFS